MRQRLSGALMAACLVFGPPGAWAQGRPDDLGAGIKQVEDGDYATAVITLDRAARALAGQPARTHDLGRAYLYLGIAYVGLGSETTARARFRDALAQSGDLTLDPEQFPPKVIELFEKARDESRQGAASAGATTPPQTAGAPPAAKKHGSKLPIVLIGVGAAAAAGVALAAGGGGGSSSSSPTAGRKTEVFNGSVSGNCNSDTVTQRFVPSAAGTLDAVLDWTDRDHPITMYLGDSDNQETAQISARSTPSGNTQARLSGPVSVKAYWMFVEQAGGGPCVTFTLTLTYPQ